MQTTVDIDERLLREAEAQARKQGKPLGSLIEEALRSSLCTQGTSEPAPIVTPIDEGLEDNDPFFRALEEIRALGRLPAPHRQVNLA